MMPRNLKKRNKTDQNAIVTVKDKMFFLVTVHWRGLALLIAPILFFILIPYQSYTKMSWVGYTLLLMGTFWVTESLPIPVTSFLPFIIFPLAKITSTRDISRSYISDTVVMFLGSLYLAYSVEQSGCHRRIAYFAIRNIGYSHQKLLATICVITTFISLFISNTAATTVMVPINFAILGIFEENKVLSVFERNSLGEWQSTDITAAYFCTTTFSATIGGTGTLISTATNLVFKGLFMNQFPTAPEYLSFPKFSLFTLPMMIVLVVYLYFFMATMYLGMFRRSSKERQRSYISQEAKQAVKAAIDKNYKRLGLLRFHEVMVVLLFGGAMVMFFCRSPQIFWGWGDALTAYFNLRSSRFIQDSAVCMLATFLMFLMPNKLIYQKYFQAKYIEDLPKKTASSVLNWTLVNKEMPYAFIFLIGGGFALSSAARKTGLNAALLDGMSFLEGLPTPVIIFILICMVVFVTNFASNIVVANLFVPIAISLAKKLKENPLLFCIVTGLTSSMCFIMPAGTPGNLIVQTVAKIPVLKMMKAGAVMSSGAIIITYLFYLIYCPIIWPVIKTTADWMTPPAPAE